MTIDNHIAKKMFNQFNKYSCNIYDLFKLLGVYDIYEDFQIEMLNLIDDFLSGRNSEKVLPICTVGCKGSGKSSVSLNIIIFLLLTQKEIIIRYCAVVEDQSKDILTKQFEKTFKRIKYGKLIKKYLLKKSTTKITNLYTKSELTVIRYSRDSVGALGLAGVHGECLKVVVIDESAGMPASVNTQIKGISLSKGRTIFILLGNPDRKEVKDSRGLSYFVSNYTYDIMNDSENGIYSHWYKINVNYLNLKRNNEEDIKWAKLTYPVGSTDYEKHVLGKYPKMKDSVMVKSYELENMFKDIEHIYNEDHGSYFLKSNEYLNIKRNTNAIYIGIDVATGCNQGYTSVILRAENIVEPLLYTNDILPSQLAEWLIIFSEKAIKYKYKIWYLIDMHGCGRETILLLNQDPRSANLKITAINNNVVNAVHYCYKTMRDELYGKMSLWFKKNNEILQTNNEAYIKEYSISILINKNMKNGDIFKNKMLTEAKNSHYGYLETGEKTLIAKRDIKDGMDILDSLCYTFFYKSNNDLT